MRPGGDMCFQGDAMYYRLHPAAALRGWQNAAAMLVKRPDNETRPLTPAQLAVLILCDGQTPLCPSALRAEEQTALQQFVESGLITMHETPLPIDEDQRYCFFENRFIQRVMWSITGACNYRCRHCFVDGPEKACHSLSTAEAMEIIDQLAACGVMQVELTGGEPLVRPDFWQLVDRLAERKIHIAQIYTNGALADEAFFAALAQRGLKPALCFSFDGVNGWHDWMRGVPGAEETTLRAMELGIRYGHDVYAGMCLHKGNLPALRETVKRLARMGVRGLNISGITTSPLWQQNNGGYHLDDREYLDAAMAYFARYVQDGQPMRVMFNGAALLQKDDSRVIFSECRQENTRQYLCGTARFAPYISEEGRLLPCMPMTMCQEQKLFPLVLEKGLAACLGDGFFMEVVSRCREDLFKHNTKCGSCESRHSCGGGCRANALRENHDFLGSDAYQCLIWREGYREKLQAALEKAYE